MKLKFLEDNFQSYFAEKNDKNLRRVRLVDKNNYIIKLNYKLHACKFHMKLHY